MGRAVYNRTLCFHCGKLFVHCEGCYNRIIVKAQGQFLLEFKQQVKCEKEKGEKTQQPGQHEQQKVKCKKEMDNTSSAEAPAPKRQRIYDGCRSEGNVNDSSEKRDREGTEKQVDDLKEFIEAVPKPSASSVRTSVCIP